MLRIHPERLIRIVVAVAMALLCALPAGAYSVLTHEQIVDLVWDDDILPLLQTRYAGMTQNQLRECHAYAYGGAVIQDVGYYPFGSRQFSDLVHYVRSGDFVAAMLQSAQDANEYCFALGAMAHYASDVSGHPAVNESVADLFPKLRRKFGSRVTYWQNRAAHLKTEFGFDVAQVAKQRYASDQYHNFIGFEVSKPLLERAFPQVYGMELKDVMSKEDLAIGTFRWSVSSVIPTMTKVAWATHKDEIVKDRPKMAERVFLYHLSRSDYEKSWGHQYQRPGVGARVLAFFMRLLPKIGPLRALALKPPTPQTEDLYFKSVDATVARYKQMLHTLRDHQTPDLPNRDCDTGRETRFAEYPLTDKTYSDLAISLAKHDFQRTTPGLRDNVLQFFSAAPSSALTSKNAADLQAALQKLRAWNPTVSAGKD
jgi:hypothetical protein